MSVSINETKQQISKIQRIIKKDLKAFYHDSDRSLEEKIKRLHVPTSEPSYTNETPQKSSIEMKDLKEDVIELKRENRELRNKSYSSSSALDTAICLNALHNRPSTTVIVNSSEGRAVSKREKKEEKKEEITAIDAVGFAVTTLPIVIGTVYSVVNDERMQLYLSGIDYEVERLRYMIDHLDINREDMHHLRFQTECGVMVHRYTEWRNKFAQRANAMLYTKLGTGTILMIGLTGLWFRMTPLMTGAAIATPFIAAYGAWHYFTADKQKEPEEEDFELLLTSLRELDKINVIGVYPSMSMLQSDYSDYVYPPVPSVPIGEYSPKFTN